MVNATAYCQSGKLLRTPIRDQMLKSRGYGAGVHFYPLYRQCENTQNFSKLFNWKMKLRETKLPPNHRKFL